jgi:parallel beta-helix repeat protein
MNRSLAFAAVLAVILAGMALSVWRVRADDNIYVRNDGSIDPPTAPITTSDNITYTLTADIISSVLVIERNNITVDGDGHMVAVAPNGIRLTNISYVRIENTEVEGCSYGIILQDFCTNNVIIGNNITANTQGISLYSNCSNNTITGNNITDSTMFGIHFSSSSNNFIYGNNFMNNANQTRSDESTNTWDDGIHGNYWSNYSGADANGDGIGDMPYMIDSSNQDRYPLMNVIPEFTSFTMLSLFIAATMVVIFHRKKTREHH